MVVGKTVVLIQGESGEGERRRSLVDSGDPWQCWDRRVRGNGGFGSWAQNCWERP